MRPLAAAGLRLCCVACVAAVAHLAGAGRAAAHDPVFAPGPHVVYEGGVRLGLGYAVDRADGAGREEVEETGVLELEYGATANLALELEVPYLQLDVDGRSASGLGDVVLRGRYRFFRRDAPAVQHAAALLLLVKFPTADDSTDPPLGSATTDYAAGLLYGREGRRWHYNVAARYRFNATGKGGFKRGDRQFVDAVLGMRPELTAYREPDTVVFLELNWENADPDERNDVDQADSGGWQLFLSPGVFWSAGNLALRGGIQIRIADDLNGRQPDTDYRLKLQLLRQF